MWTDAKLAALRTVLNGCLYSLHVHMQEDAEQVDPPWHTNDEAVLALQVLAGRLLPALDYQPWVDCCLEMAQLLDDGPYATLEAAWPDMALLMNLLYEGGHEGRTPAILNRLVGTFSSDKHHFRKQALTLLAL